MKNNYSDIALAAGVSPATVSNALNDRKGVSEKTKQKILTIAREYGYTNESNLFDNHKIIRFVIYKKHGLVISDTPFFSSLIEGIEKECRLQGYEVVISHIVRSERDDKDIIESINKDNTSGLLILATEMHEEDLELLENINIPIVLLDSYFRNGGYDSVVINNTNGAYKATECLIKNGHLYIGHLCSSIHINNFYYRKMGYVEALMNNNLKVDDRFEFYLEPTMEGSYRDMSAILEKNNVELPTAFFCDNDIIAFGAMRALKESGVKIHKDISIVGFDDMPFCEITSPRLTTIKVFKQELGSIAVKRLLAKIGKTDHVIQIIELDTVLVARDSVNVINL